MTPTIRARALESVPAHARVRHYDELAEDAKDSFPAIAEGGTAVVPPELAAGFQHGEVLKFTRYYRIELSDDAVPVRADSSS